MQKLHTLLGDNIIKNYPQLEASDIDHKGQIKFSRKKELGEICRESRSLHGVYVISVNRLMKQSADCNEGLAKKRQRKGRA